LITDRKNLYSFSEPTIIDISAQQPIQTII
jgi:hypothetical protein